LGLKPPLYLAFIYGAVLIVILFFIFLYPGIKNPGSFIVVKTEPWGAAVLVDGVYMDTAPCKIFVQAGDRKIELRLPGFLPVEMEKNIKSRLFASALFPLKVDISGRLEASSPAASFLVEAGEYADWTFAGEPSATYQIPLSLSEGAYRFGPAAADEAVRKSMEDTVVAAARFAVTRAALRDLIRAKTLLDNQGLSPSPISLLSSAGDIIGFLDKNPEAALWLGSLLGDAEQATLLSSAWYAEAEAGREPEGRFSAPGAPVLNLGLLRFKMIPGGFPILGTNFPAKSSVDTFYISETVISIAAWEAFLAQEPQWRFETHNFPGAPAGLSGTSWYAAEAFCRWLNTFLPPQYEHLELRLPTEAEWEYAAQTGALDYGNFWEWCKDPFVPLSFLSVPPAAAATIPSSERPLRGGSWVNKAGENGMEIRGSLPPSVSSPFVSFRPALGPKGNQR
jgi:hypothetical protein